MTGAALLTILTLCYVRVSLVDAAQANDPISCAAGQRGLGKLAAPGSLTVKCNAPLDTLDPKEEANVFGNEGGAGQAVALTTLIPGATVATTPAGRTVTVQQMPTGDVSVFFFCKKAEGAPEEKCVVEFQVAAASLLGPNNCAILGKSINLELRKVGETAEFGCAEDKRLFPEDANKAFDSTCSKEVDLPAGLTRRHSQDQKYHLDLKEPPKAPQKLCYLCAKSATAKSNDRCEIHVATMGAEAGGSSAVGARGATVLGLSLLAASWLSMN